MVADYSSIDVVDRSHIRDIEEVKGLRALFPLLQHPQPIPNTFHHGLLEKNLRRRSDQPSHLIELAMEVTGTYEGRA